MNKVFLMGRLVKDPEVRMTNDKNHTVARFTLAVDRKVAKSQAETDFIPCQAWDKKAEFAERYLDKGKKIIIEGRMQVSKYTNQNGEARYDTSVVVDTFEFPESKRTEEQSAPIETGSVSNEGFISIPEGVEDVGLPFH